LDPQQTLRAQFQALADWWHEDTDHISSPSRMTAHPAYQRVIAKGEQFLPCILEDIVERDGDWYLALEAIVGESPVPDAAAGDVEMIKQAWLAWGRRRGYLAD
jgi:hypothetical protein